MKAAAAATYVEQKWKYKKLISRTRVQRITSNLRDGDTYSTTYIKKILSEKKNGNINTYFLVGLFFGVVWTKLSLKGNFITRKQETGFIPKVFVKHDTRVIR